MYPGQVVVDCGAAPGGWTQVAVDKTNAALTGNLLNTYIIQLAIADYN